MLSFGVSFADATLYGWVDQSHTTQGITTNGTKATTNTWGASQGGTSAIGVKGDEDLGEGLKASYLMEFSFATENAAAAMTTNRQAYVGLDGAFGGLKIGQQYTPSFNAFASVDPSGVSTFDGIIVLNSVHKAQGFYYTTPNISGFSGVFGMHEGGKADSSANNTQTIGINYAGGALTASYTNEVTKTPTAAVSAGLNTASTISVANSGGDNTLQTFAATYDMGVAKLGVVNESVTNSATNGGQVKATHFSVAVPIGSLTLGAIIGNGSYTVAGAGAKSVDLNTTGITADYALSKRTKAYFRFGTYEDKATSGVGVITKQESSVVGLMHNF